MSLLQAWPDKRAEFICQICHKPGIGRLGTKHHAKPSKCAKEWQRRIQARCDEKRKKAREAKP